jgi:tRNA(Ile)-lysidine synthase
VARNLLNLVEKTLQTYRMLDRRESVLVAVSGGPDSVCLLHVLREMGHEARIAHFDHQTRHGDSAADAAFVRELAETLRIPFHVDSRPVSEWAAESSRSFEEFARDLRYRFFVDAAKTHGCTAIATGHHADDQAETVLMRILRGTTTRGLGGIPPVSAREGLRIVRPLIETTREEILAYLHDRGIDYCADSSNEDLHFLRNRVRHALLPHLAAEYNPKIRTALTRLAGSQRQDNDLLESLAAAAAKQCVTAPGRLDRAAFGDLHPALQRRILLRLAWEHAAAPDFEHVADAARFVIEAPAGKSFDLGDGARLCNSRDESIFVSPSKGRPRNGPIPLEVPGETTAFGKRFTVRPITAPPEGPLDRYCTAGLQVFDADRLSGRVEARLLRPGDRFTPLGMTGTKKLSDYFQDIGLPAVERDRQVLLTVDDRIAWVVGHAVDAHAAVTDDTRRLIEVEVRDAAE